MTGELATGKGLVPYSDKSVTQSGNKAGGHMAGGSVISTHIETQNVLPPLPVRETPLARLYSKLRNEVAGDPELTDYIDHLKVFTRIVEDEDVIGLDGKFQAAGREDQLYMAKQLKEVVFGQLRQFMFSRTFQTIYATLMAKIHEEFQTWVAPAIKGGASRAEIDQLVNLYVVKPVVADLEICTDYEGVAIADVRGMIYFLTGNCHLCWH